jgi:hypothetical protein
MARLNFVRGSIKGRVGEFVGSSWKGEDYIKTYTPPSNPRTEGQVAIRSVFQHITQIAAQINADILKPYTFPKPHKMTPTNRMVHINQELFDDKAWDQSKLKIFEGPLYNPGITAAVIENPGTATARVKVTFTATIGEAADKALAVVYDEASDKALFAQAERQTGELLVPIAVLGQGDASKLHAYLVFSQPPAQGTGEAGQVSGTAYLKVPAPPGP